MTFHISFVPANDLNSFAIFINSRTRAAISCRAVSRGKWPPSTMCTEAEGTVIRILWLRFQLVARLFLLRLHGSHRPHTFGFAPMGLPTRQREIADSQQHQHESIDKEQAISQHQNVTENNGGHPQNDQSLPQSGCFRNQE